MIERQVGPVTKAAADAVTDETRAEAETRPSLDRFGAYSTRVSSGGEDPAWDAFVADSPDGHHVQSSLWGQLKATGGWHPVRILVERNDEIAAGVQVLLRRLPLFGAVAYAPRGPLFGSQSPAVREIMLRQLDELVASHRIRHMTVQPPRGAAGFEKMLREAGYRTGDAAVAPVATVQIDVGAEPQRILAGMRKNHRRFVRHGLRQGVSGRLGNRNDLRGFYAMVVSTSRRQGFEPYPFEHFERMWDLFHHRGLVQLVLSDYGGDLVSGQLIMAFGDRVTAKTSGWTGEHGNLGPNHVMEWTTIEWARDMGYRWYDLEGIDARVAQRKLDGQSLTPELRRTHSFYKVGFGGEIVMFPKPLVRVPNPMLRWGYQTVFPRLARLPRVRAAVNRLRTR